MKSLQRMCVGLLLIGLAATTLSSGQDQKEALQSRFLGTWRLLWIEQPDAAGNVHKVDCAGQLIYTSDGHMAVQVMYRSPEGESGAAPVQYAQGGYEATYGTYEVNDDHTYTLHVEGALVRKLLGKDLKRAYEFSGKQLIVKSANPEEKWRVAWERQ